MPHEDRCSAAADLLRRLATGQVSLRLPLSQVLLVGGRGGHRCASRLGRCRKVEALMVLVVSRGGRDRDRFLAETCIAKMNVRLAQFEREVIPAMILRIGMA